MTYGRVRNVADWDPFESAAISHLAELVRGNLSCGQERPPHPPFGHLLPKGFSCERTWVKMCRFDSGRGGVHG